MEEFKEAIKKLDNVFSKLIRKAKYCKRCASMAGVEPAHIFVRKNLSVRWNEDNVLPLCHRCHLWAHRRQKEFKEWVKKLYGEVKWNALELRANTIKKWTVDELKELYIFLNEKL